MVWMAKCALIPLLDTFDHSEKRAFGKLNRTEHVKVYCLSELKLTNNCAKEKYKVCLCQISLLYQKKQLRQWKVKQNTSFKIGHVN